MNDLEGKMRRVIKLAAQSKQNGNLPYACILYDARGNVLLEAENTVITNSDLIGHAEINLIRQASKQYDVEFLKSCSIFTSDEPCSMCSSAIYWAGISKLVFGLSKRRFYQEFGRDNPDWDFELSSRDVLMRGARNTEIIGPILEDEVIAIHKSTL